ncbi:hypothetical protein V6Z77_002977 [Aspergillus fumigatus]
MLPGLYIYLFHENLDQFRIDLHPSNIIEHCTSDKTLISTVHVMNNITDEPGLEKRIFDEDCARKWRQKPRDDGLGHRGSYVQG